MSISHDVDASEFVYIEDSAKAFLSYNKQGEHVEFLSTYVPFAMRGRGHAERIVNCALDWAKKNRYTVSSRCWYVDKFLEKEV